MVRGDIASLRRIRCSRDGADNEGTSSSRDGKGEERTSSSQRRGSDGGDG